MGWRGFVAYLNEEFRNFGREGMEQILQHDWMSKIDSLAYF